MPDYLILVAFIAFVIILLGISPYLDKKKRLKESNYTMRGESN